MINLYDSEIIDFLPDNFQKPEILAYSYALKKMHQYIINCIARIETYTRIDELTNDILDYMALELRTQYYDEQLDITIKRNLIKNTLIWYMKAGTPSAVNELLTTVVGSGTVEEWFEYEGSPYRFKVSTIEQLTKENLEKFGLMIEKVKNVRSVLDGFDKEEFFQEVIGIGSAINITKFIKIGSEMYAC